MTGPLHARKDFRRLGVVLLDGAWRPGGGAVTERALDLCGAPPGSRALDVGCGPGASLRILAGRGFRAVGCDLAIPPETAGEGGAGRIPARLVQADALRLPFADGAFRLAICECVLSLLSRPEDALAGLRRILAAGGALAVSDLFIRGDSGPSAPAAASGPESVSPVRGCAEGARPKAAWERLFADAGLRIRHFEDHSPALAALTAQLVWHGVLSAADVRCTCSGGRPGYALWILDRP